MTYVNFKLDIDADGIALVTWDMPGRSMNVIDLKVIEELVRHRREGRGRRRHQRRGHHLRQGDVLRRRRPHHARNFQPRVRRHREGARRGAGDRAAVRGEPQALAALPPARDLRQALGRRDQRHRARRRLRAVPRLPSPRRGRQCRRRASACRRSRSASSPAPAARSASRA